MCKPKPIIGHTIKSMLGHIAIEVTADRMEVFLTLLPDSDAGQGFSVSEIQTILTEEGIVHGIRLNTIERSVEEANAIGDPVEGILIGEATPMQPQKDAHIQYNFRTSSKVEFKEDEQGRVNYQELGLINSVSQGEILAQKIPLEEGIAGLSLYGEVINPGAPKDVHLVTGKNVEMTEDSLSCRALCTGQVLLKNRIINVTHLYEVPHDVDLNIGNITFNGAVLIRGNVLGGFSIKATESVTVLGIVEGATIVCGGVLVIKGGIKGGDKCDIRCKADLVTSFVEGASIECHGNLYVETSIINSHVKCYSKIQMGTRKGIIVGGDVLGVQGIHCQETGSRLGVTTRVTIGDKPVIRERLSATTLEIEKQKEILAKIKNGMKAHQRLFDNLEVLPPQKRVPFQEVLNAKGETEKKIGQLIESVEKLQNLYHFRCLASLKVFRTIYANTIIQVGHSQYPVLNKLEHSGFFEDHEKREVEVTALA